MEIFLHHNIANLVIHTNVNLPSVLDYTVVHLKVKHMIVCDHYGCGGIKAVISNNRQEPDMISDNTQRSERLTELNVEEQM